MVDNFNLIYMKKMLTCNFPNYEFVFVDISSTLRQIRLS